MTSYLEFEKPIAELEARIAALKESASDGEIDIDAEVAKLQDKIDRQLRSVYGKLTPWQKTMVARHPERPHFKHYIAGLFDEFVPLAGDRAFADDQAIQGGFARKGDTRVMVIGHEKGDDTQSRLKHNFGMGKPEGYRKAIRLMDLAERFGLPVVTLIDTAGAFPASRPKSAARPRRSPARPNIACGWACRWWRWCWARAVRAARWRWRPPTAC